MRQHKPEPRKGSSGWIVGTGLAALYTGSVGPVAWLLKHGLLPDSSYHYCVLLYRPLDIVSHTALGPWFEVYLSWWRQA